MGKTNKVEAAVDWGARGPIEVKYEYNKISLYSRPFHRRLNPNKPPAFSFRVMRKQEKEVE